MSPHVIVWDIETSPNLKGLASAKGLQGKSDADVRAEMGNTFPKHIYHSIICIGALVAHRENEHWQVDALGCPNIGERTEKELISSFVARIAELSPQLVTFNGSSFDLPVIRYRQWSTEFLLRDYHSARISIATPKMRLIYAMSCPHEANLQDFIRTRGNVKPHLSDLIIPPGVAQ